MYLFKTTGEPTERSNFVFTEEVPPPPFFCCCSLCFGANFHKGAFQKSNSWSIASLMISNGMKKVLYTMKKKKAYSPSLSCLCLFNLDRVALVTNMKRVNIYSLSFLRKGLPFFCTGAGLASSSFSVSGPLCFSIF